VLRLALNFARRYKWAFRPEYERLRSQVSIPDLSAFAKASAEILKDKQEPLRFHFERARDALAEMMMNGLPAGAAGSWHEGRLQVRVAGSPWLTLWTYLSLRSFDHSLPFQGNLRSLCQLRSRA
jgi:hypothetical protein